MAPESTDHLAPVVRVDEARLVGRLRELATIGALPGRGVNRQAFSAEDRAARELLVSWAGDAGLAALTDPIGNLYLRHAPDGTDPQPPVLSGSHADTQPLGGWLDGAYGVVAAIEAVQSIKEAGLPLVRPVEAVVWVNEEGSRFQPGVMGSAYFAGDLDLAAAGAFVDVDGIELADVLDAYRAATPSVAERTAPFAIAGLVEAHIEQGPILEREAIPIGVVEAVQGIRWFSVELSGTAAHAGTTPLGARRDAALAATRVIQELSAALHDPADELRFTVGRLVVEPGSPNTVADRAVFTIDLRHPDAARLDHCEETIRRVCVEAAPPCDVSVTRTQNLAPVRFDAAVLDAIGAAAEALGLPSRRIVSGAGHDAAVLAATCPAGMVFVPCHGGVSHHPDEDADEADLVAGAHVLATTLARLATVEHRTTG